ncbi:helix-turn-helix transcriptional regulator [Myxosarcina sp. GI1]|uniref:ArsR/SmtB family transcription factor n=1 Tax=Myxosarcina sp. GI1 TaxID=1541065 RepID=UPI000561C2C9|nr:metalloregulator ArsR/SmtB family transcription factor [Myxosarcina sp. GI1]
MQVEPSTDSTLIMTGFHALSVPIRLAVVDLLKDRELCVCDLCQHLDLSQSKLSFHLKTLKEAKLIHSRQEGRWIYYSLNLPQFVIIEQYLAEFRRHATIFPLRNCAR